MKMMAEGQFPRIFKIGTKALDKFKRKFLLCLKMIFYAIKTVKNLASPQHNLRLTYLYDSIFALSVSGITKIAENE